MRSGRETKASQGGGRIGTKKIKKLLLLIINHQYNKKIVEEEDSRARTKKRIEKKCIKI